MRTEEVSVEFALEVEFLPLSQLSTQGQAAQALRKEKAERAGSRLIKTAVDGEVLSATLFMNPVPSLPPVLPTF